MPILASVSLLREIKKFSEKCYPQVEIEPGPLITSDSKSHTILSGLTWHVQLWRFLNFCSCNTRFLDLDSDSVRINGVFPKWVRRSVNSTNSGNLINH